MPVPPRRPSWISQSCLIALIALAVCAGLCDGALAATRDVWSPAFGSGQQAFLLGDDATLRQVLTALLDRRAAAVKGHDQAKFLRDVDPADKSLIRRQRDEYQNLVKLDLSTLAFTPGSMTRYNVPDSAAAVAHRYHNVLWAVSVTVRYSIRGLDTAPIAEPWVPIIGYRDGRWLLAGESHDAGLPTGVGGQPWETGLIDIKRGARIVVVVSAGRDDEARHLLDLARKGLAEVRQVRSSGWAGKVLVTAVDDQRVFKSYFGDNSIRDVAAIAVPSFDAVPEWGDATFVTTRVVFNPDVLGSGDDELVHDLAHEFTHAAMGPLTTDDTPLWLVEGFAEYVAYRPEPVGDSDIAAELRRIGTPDDLPPAGQAFYQEPDNYVYAWLACRLIAHEYGQAKLISLYSYFHTAETGRSSGDPAPNASAALARGSSRGPSAASQDTLDRAMRATLGISSRTFAMKWHTYLRNLLKQ